MRSARAVSNHAVELAGTTRGQYIEVPEIELSGVGAYTWQTGSGYVGLTVMFWTSNQAVNFYRGPMRDRKYSSPMRDSVFTGKVRGKERRVRNK